MSDIVFISDLHLAPERPEIIELFLQFVDDIAAKADRLYILGDFLEYWLGYDDPAPSLRPVFNKLIELDEKYATKVFFMHGNRDFLIGNKLAELDNVLLTPHIGAQTKEAQSLAANVIAEKIVMILRGVI